MQNQIWTADVNSDVARAYANVKFFDDMFISQIDWAALLGLLSYNEAIKMVENDFLVSLETSGEISNPC